MNKKHLIILSAILVLLFSCTDPIELPPSEAMATPASVLRNIVEEHDYQAKSRKVSGDSGNSSTATEDNYFRTILAHDLSRLSDLKFNEFRSIELDEYDHSDSTALYFKENIPTLSEMKLNDIKQAIKGLIQFKAIQVNKIDDTHADIYFEATWAGRESLCLLKCELNEFGIFNTEALSWREKSGKQDYPSYVYTTTEWGPTEAESNYLSMELPPKEEPKFMAAHKTIMNADGKKNLDVPEDFTHHGETQENMLKALLEWRDHKNK